MIQIKAAARLQAAQADVQMAKKYIEQVFGVPAWLHKNDHGLIEFEIDFDDKGKALRKWEEHFGPLKSAKTSKDNKGSRMWTVDIGDGRSIRWRRDDYQEASYVALLDSVAAKGKPVALGLKLLKEITSRCSMPPPNKNNTEEYSSGVSYKANLGHNVMELRANDYLTHLGFKGIMNQHGGGSTRGDFSSDLYSTTWKNKGVTIHIGSYFGSGQPTISVSITGPADELAALEAKR